MNDTQEFPSRAILHAHLSRTFTDPAAPRANELRAFMEHLLAVVTDHEKLAKVLADMTLAALAGQRSGYSVNPQNDIVDHVMAVYDAAFSQDHQH